MINVYGLNKFLLRLKSTIIFNTPPLKWIPIIYPNDIWVYYSESKGRHLCLKTKNIAIIAIRPEQTFRMKQIGNEVNLCSFQIWYTCNSLFTSHTLILIKQFFQMFHVHVLWFLFFSCISNPVRVFMYNKASKITISTSGRVGV